MQKYVQQLVYVVCAEKGYHYLPSFCSRGLGHPKSCSRCIDALANQVPTGQTKI